MLYTLLLVATQIAPLTPALPTAAAVFDSANVQADIDRLCGAGNRRCREVQEANISLLREKYEERRTPPDQKLKLLNLIDNERSHGVLDWMIIRSEYTKWMQAKGLAPTPSYPAPTRNTTRCTSRMSGGVYTSECTSY